MNRNWGDGEAPAFLKITSEDAPAPDAPAPAHETPARAPRSRTRAAPASGKPPAERAPASSPAAKVPAASPAPAPTAAPTPAPAAKAAAPADRPSEPAQAAASPTAAPADSASKPPRREAQRVAAVPAPTARPVQAAPPRVAEPRPVVTETADEPVASSRPSIETLPRLARFSEPASRPSYERRYEPFMSDARSPRLAVLIDADNASARIADGLFQEIAAIGEASVRRIYGDFSSTRSKGWADVLSKHAIIPQQQFAYVTGKNASDIALVIDAMDLMHSGRFDGFCIVSSDSDFTRLAARIRENGLDVYGFGEQKTPESFRQACRRFIYTENLIPGAAAAGKPAADKSVAAVPMLQQVMDQIETEDGWVPLGTFGKQLLNRFSDFDPRTYGQKKLSDFVRAVGIFDIEKTGSGMIRIRLKPAEASEPAQAPAPKPASRRASSRRRGSAEQS
ncbi:hypothetical protein GGR04_002851 [Aureimonas pseudogalii]|uniref:HTH OST-type domain-containing protein n=2 Tax=Aureimonas pseudogalii TaxID=1744844 RepID=A0A7W6H5N5_9HYPH|nr:hypothetical protein [Aureimonas pseudogalii]